MIYLDYAATTPVDPKVQETITHALKEYFGNPSSLYRLGKTSKNQLMLARQKLRDLLQINEDAALYFTSGATEANNWALRAQAFKARELGLGKHIVTTTIEHSCVEEDLLYLEKQGFEVTRIAPNKEKNFALEQFVEATREDTIGWSAMAVNNELGTVLPIKELGQWAKENNLWFHVDSTQAVGYLSTHPDDLVCTSFTGSGHKFYAPKGIGFLVYQPWNKDISLQPIFHGGGQEYKMRSGTENLPYILGMVKALELMQADQAQHQDLFTDLSEYLFTELDKAGVDYQRNGSQTHHNHRIHNIWLKGHLASQVIIHLDLAGIYISAGSACSAGSVTPSRVLKAYYPEEEALWGESIRISFGKLTTKEDIDELVKALKKL